MLSIKEELQKKFDELEALKLELLKIEAFLNPDNNSFVYSTENLAGLAGTQGSTPSNLSEILEVIVLKINEYVDYIKELPYAESSVIYRDRPEKDLAVVSTNRIGFHSPVAWTVEAENVDVGAISSFLAISEYYGRIKSMRFYASPSIRKVDSTGRDISTEVKLLRINSRLNEKNEFRSGTGPLDALLTDDILAPDDIYIIGIMITEPVANDIVYYQDLTYTIEYTFLDETTEKVTMTMGNRMIGNMLFDADLTLNFGLWYWDILTIGSFDIELFNSIGDSTEINTFSEGEASGGLFDGNIISSIKTGAFRTDISNFLVSYRSGCSWYRNLFYDTFDLYDKNTSDSTHIIFNNLRPIDLVLEEAINEL